MIIRASNHLERRALLGMGQCAPERRAMLGAPVHDSGSVLIIVLWIAFGLVALTLYFANSMAMELRAVDNRVASVEADQAIEGAACYVSNILANLAQPGSMPDPENYRAQAVPVGEAKFWLIGRDTNGLAINTDQPVFGLVAEASKINLNTATAAMLQNFPNLTANLAGAIFDWRSTNATPSQNGAKSETYSKMLQPYSCKNTNYESIDELRLVSGMDLNTLYGEDVNLNGALDANEDDADALPPTDNHNGVLEPGLLEYVTVWTHESIIASNGLPKINVTLPTAPRLLRDRLNSYHFDPKKIAIIYASGTATGIGWLSPLALYRVNMGGISAEDFAQFEGDLRGANTNGLININTASQAVLACVPGIGPDNAAAVVAYRNANPNNLTSVAWLVSAIDPSSANEAGAYVTTHTYQFTADVAAVGRFGRGYRRVKFVFDTASGAPRIVYRQDLTHLGWALGRQARQEILLAKEMK